MGELASGSACDHIRSGGGSTRRREAWKKSKGGEGSSEPERPRGKLPFAAIYAGAAIIGFTPQQVNDMSLWQWMTVMNGYVAAHSPENKGLSDDEADDLAAYLDKD